MNIYMKAQINNLEIIIENFIKTCELSAIKDDGIIDKKEEKQLNKIKKLSEKYLKDIKSI